jgi:hypothetical protein
MKNRPSSASKSIATELANLVFDESHDYEKMENLLGQLDVPAAQTGKAAEIANKSKQEALPSVGIWQQLPNNKQAFKRDQRRQPEWFFWADVPEIKPRSSKKRILLFGESVARGFLYDPYYSVAKELQASLNMNQGLENTEVIDLAKTGIQMPELLSLIQSAAILEPDAVVIFGGNNWFFAANTHPIDFSALTDIYKKGGYTAVKTFLEKILSGIVKDFLRKVEAVFKSRKIPIVFVIPEFNLKDWKSAEIEKIPAWSANGSIASWLSAAEKIDSLQGNYNEAYRQLAEQMIEADQSNPLGYELLAAYYLHHQQVSKARLCLEQAKETVLFNRSNNSMPRCVAAIRQTILEEAARSKMLTLDLPQLFRELQPDSIPDRKIFMDNCHLTWEMIKVVVQHLTPILSKNIPGLLPCNQARVPALAPSNHVKAIAHFSAAIYNAHHAQPYEIIAYHCRQAVALSPAVKEPMRLYADFATRKTNSFLCKSFHDLMMTGELTQYEGGFSLGHQRNNKLYDGLLVDAIAAALEGAGADKNIGRELETLRLKDHFTDHVNLLETCYWKQSYIEFASPALEDYLQTRSGQTTFYFASDGNSPLSFRLTYRTPHAPEGSALGLRVNDMPGTLVKFTASHDWTTVSFSLDAAFTSKGMNRLVIDWPCLQFEPANESPANADAFLRNIFPVFGELYELSMHTAASSLTRQKQATAAGTTAV